MPDPATPTHPMKDRTLFEYAQSIGWDGERLDALQDWLRESAVPSDDHPTPTTLDMDSAEDTAGTDRATPARLGLAPEERYKIEDLLGEGGMAQVWRVHDRTLNRTVAMKMLHNTLRVRAHSLQRFREEAQVCAQLQHPGIVPIHEIGQLSDGRMYFTMQEVRGHTLLDAFQRLNEAEANGQATTPQGETLHSVVRHFHGVCQAVAFAHANGVVHRDLKPENVMIGDYGEVLVLDWGLARLLDQAESAERDIRTSVEGAARLKTRMGAIAGTPAYMSPEQARAENEHTTPRSDVYALGATLYELMTGVTPYRWKSGEDYLDQIRRGDPIPLPQLAAPERTVPEDLAALAMACLSFDPADRPANAEAVAREVDAWLTGARRRERALAIVAAADARLHSSRELDDAADTHEAEAQARIDAGDPEAGWTLLDAARTKRTEAQRHRAERMQQLQSALSHDPTLPEAHDRIADAWLEVHRRAEANGDTAAAQAAEPWIRAHHRGRHAAYLCGEGALTLVTDPPGATATLHRYVSRNRRLVPERVRDLGPTPLVEVPLDHGSYLVTIEHPDCHPVRYPVFIRRQEHWDGVPPGATEPEPIDLPPRGSLGPDDLYVPAGWFIGGGDHPQVRDPVPRQRVWCHAMVHRRFPVRNDEYVAFLNALVRDGRTDEAEAFAPRQRGGRDIHARTESGEYVLGTDPDGHVWHPDMPVVLVDWAAALAFAVHTSTLDGHPWRLPYELEWAHAARGADGRAYPWGNDVDESFAHMRGSPIDRPGPSRLGGFPADVSPYGLRHCAGNVHNWMLDPGHDFARVVQSRVAQHPTLDAHSRRCRGGGWTVSRWWSRIDVTNSQVATNGSESVGLRLCRPWKKM